MSTINRAALVEQLMAAGATRANAERRADATIAREGQTQLRVALKGERRDYDARQRESSIDLIDEVPVEDDVQRAGVALYESSGCTVYNLSQKRASKQGQGLPDSWVFPPEGYGPGWWHEWKRPGGGRSEAQELFKRRCDETGTSYVCGGVEAARTMLRRRGLL